MNLGDLTLNIILNSGSADKEAKQFTSTVTGVSTAMTKAETVSVSFKDKLANIGLAYQGLTAVIGVFKSTFSSLLSEYQKQEVAEAKLLNNLKQTGEGMEAFNKLKKQAEGLRSVTVYDDDEIMNAQAMLGTFKKTSEQIEMMTPRMLDLSAAFDASGQGGKGLVEVAVMMGKVSEETIGTLRRVGVAFSKEEEEKLKSLQGTEQTIYFMHLLDNNFRGLAETVGKTSAGQMKIFEHSVNDVKKSLGSFVASAIGPVISGLSGVISKGGGMSDFFKVIILGAMAAAAAFVVLNTSMGGIPYIVIGVVTAMTALWTAIHPVSVSADEFKKSIDESNKSLAEYSEKIEASKSNIEGLELIYNRLSNTTVLTEAEQKNYEATLGRMTALYPQIMSQVDEYSGRLTTNKEVIEKLIVSEKERLQITQNARTSEQMSALDNMIAKYKDVGNSMDDLIAKQKQLQDDVANGGYWKTDAFTGNQSKVDSKGAQKELDEVNKELYQTQTASDLVAKSIYDAIEQGIKFKNVGDVLDRVKASVQGSELATKSFFSVMSSYTGQAINDWSQIAGAIQFVKNLMNSTGSGTMGPDRPNKSNIEGRISEINKQIETEPDSKKIQEYKKDIKSLEAQRDKLLGVDNKSKGSSPRSKSVEKEVDAVKELIDVWNKQIDVYYTADEFQSKFTSEGKSLVDVFKAINQEITDNKNLTDDQVLSLVKYRDTVLDMIKDSGGSLKNLFAGGVADGDPNQLAQQYAKERMDWYAQYGSKDKRFKPLDESTEYVEALKMIKELNGETLKEADYQSFIVSLKRRANLLDVDSEKSLKLKLILNQAIQENEQKLMDMRRRQLEMEYDIIKRRMELSDDEFANRRTNIDLEYRQESDRLADLEKKAISQKELNEIRSLQNINRAKKQRQLEQADSDEMNSQAYKVHDAFTGSLSNAQIIARLFGSAGNSLVESFNRALAITQGIKAIFDTVALIKGIISLFSGGVGGALPAFHDGGTVGGMPAGDVPIIAQEGEGIIRRPRMRQLSSIFGSGFFNFLNGTATPNLKAFGVYHSGGIVAAAASGYGGSVREVPYILTTEISGANLKHVLIRQNKIDSHRSNT